MLKWIKRKWPLMLKSTCQSWIDDINDDLSDVIRDRDDAEAKANRLESQAKQAEARASDADKKAEEARAQMVIAQAAFTRMMRSRQESSREWDHYADKAMMLVDGSRGAVMCHVVSPGGKFEMVRVDRFRFAATMHIEIGLGRDCPPELVADYLADHLRKSVLTQWQHQSVLLKIA